MRTVRRKRRRRVDHKLQKPCSRSFAAIRDKSDSLQIATDSEKILIHAETVSKLTFVPIKAKKSIVLGL